MWGSSGLSHEPSPLLTCSSIWSSSCPGFNQHTNAEGAHIYHSKPLTIRPKYLTPYLTSSPRWKGNDRPKTFFLSNPSSSTHCQQLDTWYQLLRVEMSHPWWAPDLTLPPTRVIPVSCSAYFPGVIQTHFPRVQSLHFSPGHLISCLVYCVCVLDAQSCPTLRSHGLWPTRLFCSWNSPGKNTGAGCHSLLQGNHPDSEINPGSLGRFFTVWAIYNCLSALSMPTTALWNYSP